MASRSDIPTTYAGKNATFIPQGQTEQAKNYGMNPQAKTKDSGAPKAVGSSKG